jgi:hypothetical protein
LIKPANFPELKANAKNNKAFFLSRETQDSKGISKYRRSKPAQLHFYAYSKMRLKILVIALLFLIVRLWTVMAYKDLYYYYGMVWNQFAIAEALYHGHWFSVDYKVVDAVQQDSAKKHKFIPIEEWGNYPKSGNYTGFPVGELPGLGYLIAMTSKMMGSELTSRYALIIQIFLELTSILIFVYCISLILGENVAFIAGIIYIFGYPFIWPIAVHPMRDIFVMGTYSFYLMAFILFSRRQDFWVYFVIIALVILAALLLWFRLSAYYFFFFVSPLVFFLKNIKMSQRIFFFLISMLISVMIFGYPFRQFNIRHYKMAEVDYLGRFLWEGMGIEENNQYGFVCDDGAIVPWAESRGYNYYYGSPELNKLLGDYARKIIKEDPLFYFKTVRKRIIKIIKFPLDIASPSGCFGLYVKYGKCFFNLGIIFSILMVIFSPGKRIQLIVLLTPFFYILLFQIFVYFEARYLATGAWVLILPLAWFTDNLIKCVARNFFNVWHS